MTAKRKLSNIKFEKEGAHVALVSKQQGGPANGKDFALVMKATNFSEEFVTKMQQVRVTMELPEFLTKFFYVYGSDAEVLARMMGYVEAEDELDDLDAEEESYDDWYENYIQSRLDQFEVLKSLHESKDIASDILKLGEEKYLKVLKSQAKLEKILAKIEKNSTKAKEAKVEEGSTEAVAKAKQSDENDTKVEPSNNTNKGKTYMDELQEVQKALADQALLLKAAQDQVAALQAEKSEAIRKARFAKVESLVGKETAEVLFKALSLVEDEAEFEAVLKGLSTMQAAVDKSALFEEQGKQVSTEGTDVKESAVAKAVKQNLAKAAK